MRTRMQPRILQHVGVWLLLPLLLSACAGAASGGAGTTDTSLRQGGEIITVVESSDSTGTTGTTEKPFVQNEGEILLEGARELGPEPFMDEGSSSSVGNRPDLSPGGREWGARAAGLLAAGTGASHAVAAVFALAKTTGENLEQAYLSGDYEGLYGGTKNKRLADKERQLRFLEKHHDRAVAFCAALNSDPGFTWSGGKRIDPSQLKDYFKELTPMLLMYDTRVTNHGFRDGMATPRQSVLQNGQVVLVDTHGIPRVRGECGNPLIPPQPVAETPTYTGKRWNDFSSQLVVAVKPSLQPIRNFSVFDLEAEWFGYFTRPAGSDGSQDGTTVDTQVTGTDGAWQLSADMSFIGNPVPWTAEISVGADSTVSGSTTGSAHLQGTISDSESGERSWEVDVRYRVDITGTLETTAAGSVLHITATPTVLDFQNFSGRWADADSLMEMVPGWSSDAAFTVDLPAVGSGSTSATFTAPDGYEGTATLTSMR